MKTVNPNSPCMLGCKYLTKCHADKSIVIECKRYEPKEEYAQLIRIIQESEE